MRNSDIPAFTYDFSISYSKNNIISSCLWTCKKRYITFELFTTCSLDVHCMSIPFTTTNSNIDVHGGPLFFKCRNVGLSGNQSVRYRNDQKCRCRNRSGAGIRGLRYRMPECRCRRHRPRCRCPAMPFSHGFCLVIHSIR